MAWFEALYPTDSEIEINPFATATDAELASIINGYYNGDITLSQIQEATMPSVMHTTTAATNTTMRD